MSKYLVSLPQSQRSKYLENENVDFLMDFEGYNLKPNSVKLTGTLIVSKDVPENAISAVGGNDDILMDGVTGIDACFQSFTTSVGNTVVENNPEYPRFQKMNLTASQSKAELVADTENVSALRMYSSSMGKNILQGTTNPGEVPFCFKPNICLNNSQGLSGSSQVRLSLRLASTRDVVYGGDVVANTSYWLQDLRVEYEVMPAGKSQKGFMVVNHCLKQVINNGNANLSMVVPVPSSKISCSMIQTDHLNSTSYNHLALEKPENVTRVELHINDGTSQVVSYPLETEQEILAEYLRSLGLHKHNTIRVKDLIGKKKFGFGYSYTTMMKGAKIGLQIESDLNTPYAIYSYFSSVLEL